MDINLGFQFKEKSNGYGKFSALQLSPSVINGKAHTAIEKETYKSKPQIKNQEPPSVHTMLALWYRPTPSSN
jgi:hypothetical protein